MVIEDIQNNIVAMNKKQIQELMKENLPKPKFKIEYPDSPLQILHSNV